MNIQLNSIEARVLGSLMEKQVTTPDQYPLSLNALTLACNQKTNRDPVLELSDSEVQAAVDSLMKKYWVSDRSAGYGGRVTKYQQRFCNTEFGPLKLSSQEFAVVCLLLLRGAQTPGELRSRAQRLADFVDVSEVEQVLAGLMRREEGPFVARLERRPGEREVRYRHVFFGAVDAVPAAETSRPEAPSPVPQIQAAPAVSELQVRVDQLERAVAALQQELASLRSSQPS